jgi:hypothetical protein
MLEIIGFHATSQDNVNSIINNGFIINKRRDNEWLGYGIYLFKYRLDAYTWGKGTYYCRPNPKLIKCYAKVEKEKYLDLDDPEKLYDYDEYYGKTLKILSNANKEIKFKNKNEAMCWGLSLYKKDKDIDAIKYTFRNDRTKNSMEYKNNALGYEYNETQICITSNKVIFKKELYSWEELKC